MPCPFLHALSRHWSRLPAAWLLLTELLLFATSLPAPRLAADESGTAQARFVDHSLLIAPDYPCTWPAHPFPRFQIVHQRTRLAVQRGRAADRR